MRLVDTSTLALLPNESPEDVEYAILSHRWGKDEVLFEDAIDGSFSDRAIAKKRFSKIQGLCNIARAKGIKRAWIDTCCI